MTLKTTPTKKSLPVSAENTPLERKCLRRGVKVTPSRHLILEILEHATDCMSADQIYLYIQNAYPREKLSPSTVYSNIKTLADKGVIQRHRHGRKQTYSG